MYCMKKSYKKRVLCFILAFIFIFLQTATNIYAGSYEIDDKVIVDGFTPPKDTTIIHHFNTAEKPYTKIANAVNELWVGDHHRYTVVENRRDNVKIRWYSSNPEVAGINKVTGELTALSAGTTTITMWDSVNKLKQKTNLTVKAVPVLPEIPREWYTIAEKPKWISEEGIQIVLKSEYRYLYEQCSILRIPDSVNGEKVVWICSDDDPTSYIYYPEHFGFTQLKMLQCPASIAFYIAGDLDELIYPEGTQRIDSFDSGYRKYKRIHVPESVKLLVSNWICHKEIEEVRIPASVKFFCCNLNADTAVYFYGIGYGENARYVVDGNNTNYYSISNVLFSYPYYEEGSRLNWIVIDDYYEMSAGKHTLLAYPKWKTDDVYYVPDGIERIETGAFKGTRHLKKIVLPDSVTEIGELAFDVLGYNKVEITIPASVTKIEDDIFGGPFGIFEYDDERKNTFTIITPKGSVAEAYAIEKGIAYRNE